MNSSHLLNVEVKKKSELLEIMIFFVNDFFISICLYMYIYACVCPIDHFHFNSFFKFQRLVVSNVCGIGSQEFVDSAMANSEKDIEKRKVS